MLGSLRGGINCFTEGVGMGTADAKHAVQGHHGEVTAKAVCNSNRFPFGQSHGGPLWNKGGFYFAGEGALVFGHGVSVA